MVPFASTTPVPACERRRVRNANHIFFSIMARSHGDLFSCTSRKCRGGVETRADLTTTRGVVSSSHKRHRSGSGGNGGGSSSGSRGRRARPEDVQPVPDLEEQLYAVLGALLEVRQHY